MKIQKNNMKEYFLIIIAILLIGIGYLNFGFEENDEKNEIAKINNEANLGDVELVSALVSNEELNENTGEKEDKNYFTETKIQRDKMFSEMIEMYEKMIKNSDVPPDQKAIATQEIENINKKKNAIMIAENLIKNKGFENVILVNENNINVIIDKNNLFPEEVSQIQNIIKRELSVEIVNISITNKY